MSRMPVGWLASAVAAGTKTSRGLDLALICSDRPATVAGAFTTNRALCAHIQVCAPRVASGAARGVLVSAGIANAGTGDAGVADATRMAALAAEAMDVPTDEMLTCATGVIGGRIPVDDIAPAITEAAQTLSPDGWKEAANAIMTMDTRPKIAARSLEVDGTTVTVGGVAKGAGMIAPDMRVPHATMLAFITTDATATPETLRAVLSDGLPRTFNAITVDGATSTNDTVLLFANGASGAKVEGSDAFTHAVHDVMRDLAYAIVADGEGATTVIRIGVRGAATDIEAASAARAVADNILFRAAIWGGDPNAGRVLQAIGQRADVTFDPRRISIAIGDVELVSAGVEKARHAEAAKGLGGPEVLVAVDLGLGDGTGEVLTCDLTPEYVKLNADYRT